MCSEGIRSENSADCGCVYCGPHSEQTTKSIYCISISISISIGIGNSIEIRNRRAAALSRYPKSTSHYSREHCITLKLI